MQRAKRQSHHTDQILFITWGDADKKSEVRDKTMAEEFQNEMQKRLF